MKRVFLIFLTLMIITYDSSASAQSIIWDDPICLTNSPGRSDIGPNNGWVIATDSYNRIHIVWCDERDGNTEIYYKRWNGSHWEDDRRLTNDTAGSGAAAIAVDGSDFIHVVWADTRNGGPHLRYIRSIDGGISWSDDTTELTPHSHTNIPIPSICAWEHTVHVFFTPVISGMRQIVTIRSIDNGLSWLPYEQLTTDTSNKESPVGIIGQNGWVHVVWADTRDNIVGDRREVYYKRCRNGIWEIDTRLTYDAENGSCDPTIAVDKYNRVHVVWHDDRDSGSYNHIWNIYYKLSPDGGSSWPHNTFGDDYDSQLTFKEDDPHPNHTETDLPCMAADTNGNIHVVWHDRDIPGDFNRIFYKQLKNVAWEDTDTLCDIISAWPSIATDKNNNIHVIWSGIGDGLNNSEIYYRKGVPVVAIEENTKCPDKLGKNTKIEAHPNPFIEKTVIEVGTRFIVSNRNLINQIPTLQIYDLAGQAVKSFLITNNQSPITKIVWDGRDEKNNLLPSGIYFVKLKTGEFSQTKKLEVIR